MRCKEVNRFSHSCCTHRLLADTVRDVIPSQGLSDQCLSQGERGLKLRVLRREWEEKDREKEREPVPRWMQHRREQERKDANVCLRRYVATCGGVGKKYVCVKSVQCGSAARETTDANSFSLSLSLLHSTLAPSPVRWCVHFAPPPLWQQLAHPPTHTHTVSSGHSCRKLSQCQALLPYFGPGNQSTSHTHTHGKAWPSILNIDFWEA